jgi:UDP-N-acetylmuramate--alanine ligase
MFGINKELKIHFIGIGGIGMSGIAEILINLGYHVSGSDITTNPNTEKLKSKGAEIFLGHKSENIKNVQLIVYSSAIDETNPEIMQARDQGLPIIKRAEMLAELMRLKFGVAIAGSHGKTTTTSFLSTILKELDYKPTCIVGGVVKNLGGHALKGDSQYLIAEADESDGSFLFLNPIMSIITNIDNDHLDYYKTVENIEKAFEEFANKVPFYGHVAININDAKSRKLRDKIRRPYVTYGVFEEGSEEEKPEYYASNIIFTENGTSFDVHHKEEKVEANITLAGEHNVLNALSAIVIAHKLESNLACICSAIKHFEGVGRRFELLYNNEKMVVVDDYGHHPTEVLATLQTAKDKYPNKKIIAVFEPHRFSRTKEFWNEFRDSFENVEKAYIAPIYAASENPILGITSDNLVADINKQFKNAELLPNWGKLPNIFEQYKNENVIILSMGAGSISKMTRQKLEEWTK